MNDKDETLTLDFNSSSAQDTSLSDVLSKMSPYILQKNPTGFGLPFNSIFGNIETTQTQSIQNNTYGTESPSFQNNANGSFRNYTLPEGLQIHQSNNTDVVTVDYNDLCKKYSINMINQNEQGNRSYIFKQKN